MAQVENWKIQYVMDCTGCSAEKAVAYLEAEEWVALEAVASLRADELAEKVK